MKFCAAIDILLTSAILAAISPSSIAFTPKIHSSRANHGSSSSLKIVVGDTVEEFEARVDATFEKANPKDPSFEAIVQAHFGGAISNQDLVTTAARLLASKGYNGENTLLATSLCCDELARQLEDDFNGIYGNNFNLGGLAGFPFAGKTGFGAMAAHIPDDGYCLVVYGPHVGVSSDGTVGKVERNCPCGHLLRVGCRRFGIRRLNHEWHQACFYKHPNLFGLSATGCPRIDLAARKAVGRCRRQNDRASLRIV